uniref:Bric-A-brac n=1 Tax=Rhipicephalus zambeziensis TaxID=60191 RepID=A0A224YTF3_9ACAR
MGGLTAQQFCLKWNQHHGSLVSVYEELRSRDAFVDVTLVCEEGVSMKAHKLVLAACSPFFEALFERNPCAHPVVIMSQTREADLRTLLEFMYRGEVNVAQDQLPALLRTAELFQVRGLAEVAGENPPGSDEAGAQHASHLQPACSGVRAGRLPKRKQRTPPPPAAPRHDEPSPVSAEGPDSPEPAAPKARSAAKPPAPASRRTFDHSYSDDKTNWVPAVHHPEHQKPVLPPPAVPPDTASGDDHPPPVCSVCSRVFSTKGNLKRHMLMHRPYRHKHQCTLCLKTFSWPGDLRTHLRVAHGQGRLKPRRLPYLFT